MPITLKINVTRIISTSEKRGSIWTLLCLKTKTAKINTEIADMWCKAYLKKRKKLAKKGRSLATGRLINAHRERKRNSPLRNNRNPTQTTGFRSKQ